MDFTFPAYNPNYEERRGRRMPAHNAKSAPDADREAQNAQDADKTTPERNDQEPERSEVIQDER